MLALLVVVDQLLQAVVLVVALVLVRVVHAVGVFDLFGAGGGVAWDGIV